MTRKGGEIPRRTLGGRGTRASHRDVIHPGAVAVVSRHERGTIEDGERRHTGAKTPGERDLRPAVIRDTENRPERNLGTLEDPRRVRTADGPPETSRADRDTPPARGTEIVGRKRAQGRAPRFHSRRGLPSRFRD